MNDNFGGRVVIITDVDVNVNKIVFGTTRQEL